MISPRLVDSLMFAEMTSLFLHVFLFYTFYLSPFLLLNTADLLPATSVLCVFLSWCSVSVSAALCSEDWRAPLCSQSEDCPSLSPQRGVSTDGLLDARWTGRFSSLDANPENSSCLFLTPVFPLMMCGQAANMGKNKSEWFRQLLLFHICLKLTFDLKVS